MLRTMRPMIVLAALICAVALVLAAAPHASSQIGGQYDLTWNTAHGGGTTSASGGVYQLGNTIGAVDVGQLGGGNYGLGVGFWGGSPLVSSQGQETVYLPMLRR